MGAQSVLRVGTIVQNIRSPYYIQRQTIYGHARTNGKKGAYDILIYTMQETNQKKGFLNKIAKYIGPGIITGASDDEASGILTYLQSGVMMGLSSLWTALFSLPLMYAIQEMCGRIGYITDGGIVKVLRENFSKWFLYPIVLVSLTVVVVNIGADLLAMSVVLEHVVPIQRIIFIPLVALVIALSFIAFSYERFSNMLRWVTLSLLFYVAVVFFIRVEWGSILYHTFVPSLSFSKETFLLLSAIIGTTISPYLFFWQANEEAEERNKIQDQHPLKRFIITKRSLKVLRRDTLAGMILSNIVMWFILVAGTHIASYGMGEITSFQDAALALEPLLGSWAFAAFGLGIIGTGLLAIPVLAGSVGYMIAELFHWHEGINRKFKEAKGFYLVIVASTLGGVITALLGANPVQLLIATAFLYAIITPVLIFFIMIVANSTRIMKGRTNSLLSNILGSITLLVTLACVTIYLII